MVWILLTRVVMSKAHRPWSSLVVTLLSLAGCSGGPRPVPIKAADEYAAKVHSGGLSAGAEPFDTYAKSNQFFGAWVSREFTPVQLVVESRAPDKFLLKRERAKLTCDDGKSLEPVSALTMFEPYRDPILPVPGFGFSSGAASADSNERLKSDWTQKEFPAETILTTGGRAGGFLYFRGTCFNRYHRQLELTAEAMSSSEVVTLSFELR